MHQTAKRTLILCFLACLICLPMMVFADVYSEYEVAGTKSAYRTDPNVNSRRTDHFLIRFGPKPREGFMVEQMYQGQMQFLENVYETWRALGLHDLGGTDPTAKYKLVIEPAETWDGDMPGTAVGFGEGPTPGGGWVPGIHIPCNSLAYKAPNGCTPHECGHGWQNQHTDARAGGLPAAKPQGFTESLANWIMQQSLVGYPQDFISVGVPMAHACVGYNCMSIFNYFMYAPGYGVNFINKLIFDPNLNDWNDYNSDDIIRKAIRVDTSGSADHSGAIHDGLGMMNAKMLDMDLWNHRVNNAYSYDQDTTWSGYQFNRIPMVKQPGVTGTWYRPEWTCIPQTLSNNYIPLNITATGSPRTVTCDFRPVADAVRGSSFRACFVAFNSKKEPRYGKVWNVGENSFSLADDDTAVYLAVIACPYAMNPTGTGHSDYTLDNVAMFPYRISLTGATPKGWQWAAPTSNFHNHTNGGGKVANTATVDASAYVGPNAMVLGSAKVYGNSRIEDYAVVDSSAIIGRLGQSDNPVISGHAYVTGTSQVYGHAKVRDYAWVWGASKVYDNAIVMAHTMLNGATVFGSAVMNQAPLRDTGLNYNGTYSGSAQVGGDCSSLGVMASDKGVWCEFPAISVEDNKYQYLGYNFEKKSCVFAMDQYGMNHSYLMGEPQVKSDRVNNTTTNVLELNGTDQYIELRPDAVDFADITISMWVKWTGSTPDQKIISTGDGNTKYMYLTPQDGTTGKLRFVISNGTATQYLDGTAPLANGTWTHVAVVLSGNTGALYVNGTAVDTDTAISVDPDQLYASNMENANYIGRGNSGGWFAGRIDEFKVYNKALDAADIPGTMIVAAGTAPAADTVAPTPSTATWLVNPTVASNGSITMSATEGKDAGGNGVLYYFRCVNDPTHDSGWISENTYKDCKAVPGASYTYAVKMKDNLGNAGNESTQLSATAPAADATAPTPNPPTFSSAPKGDSTTSITMTATKATDDDELVMYKFSRVGGTQTSGWTTSRIWTDTGLTSGKSYSYTLQVKDGHGNTTSSTTSASTVAKDNTPPALDPDFRFQWETYPYTQLDKTVRMYAKRPVEADVDYYYECVENPTINSGWMVRPTSTPVSSWTAIWVTPVLADGSYTFRYKIRDKSAAQNISVWSEPRSAKVLTTNCYHDYTLPQLSGLPDSTLVRFGGKVTQINVDGYTVSTADGLTSIKVVPRTYGYKPDSTLLNQNVNVKGHLWTYTGSPKCVTGAIVAGNPQTNRIEFENCEYDDDLARPLYDVNASGCEYLGWYQDGWSVTIPNVAAATQLSITYRGGGKLSLYLNGSHYKDLTLPDPGNKRWGSTTFTGLSIAAGSTLKLQEDSGDSTVELDYMLVGPAYTISGKVTNASGVGIVGASVHFSAVPNASLAPTYIAVTDASGNYSQTVTNGTWYVAATAASQAYLTSEDQTVVINGAAKSNVNFTLQSITRNFPRPDDLLVSFITDMLPDAGEVRSWMSYIPTGMTFGSGGVPSVEIVNGQKWERNTTSTADCFRSPAYSAPIPVNGATIVVAIKPIRYQNNGYCYGVVSAFFDRLTVGVESKSGRITVARNGSWEYSSYTIPDGQISILSLVMQPDGQYKVYVNGTAVLTNTSVSPMTSLPPSTHNNITVGSNGPDGASTFNGNIGDVAFYKVALTDAERQELEGTMAAKFGVGIPSYTINASTGTGGTITPSGAVTVYTGTDATFAITPEIGYVVADVKVDNASVGAVESYTFTNVKAAHTISATFRSVPTYTITASSGSGGGVNPAGATIVNAGSNKTFTITPLLGYAVDDVKVDNVSVGAVPSYTFSNITSNHTISATFMAIPNTVSGKVTASADGAAIAGASVYFSSTANASANPTYTATTDAEGNYSQEVAAGTWYVAAGKTGFKTTDDQTAEAIGGSDTALDFALAVSSDVYYKFDETTGTTAADSAGNGRNGTLTNGPAWATGRAGNCLSFDGTNDYVSVPNLSDFTAMTIAGWVNLDTLGTDSTGSAIFACDGSDAGDVQLLILKSGGKLRFSLIGNTTADNDSTYAFTSADFGKWRHVAVVYDSVAKTVKFYINGGLNATRTLTTARTASLAGGLRVGSWSGGRYFDGKIDEFHIYEKALNANEIAALVNSSPSMRIADAKKLANGEVVTLADKLVTYAPRNAANARNTSYFYIEEADRSAGLYVQDSSGYRDDLNVDTPVTVSGVMKTITYTGQRYLELSALPGPGTASVVNPLGMTTKSVQTDLSALGLLVRVVGKVVEISPDKDWFTMADGHGFPTIVLCETGIPLSGFIVGDTVVVTGAVGRDIGFSGELEGIVFPRAVVKL